MGLKNIWNPRMEIRGKRGQPTWAGRLGVRGDWARMAAGEPDHKQLPRPPPTLHKLLFDNQQVYGV